MFVLPVSLVPVRIRPPDGHDEIFLAEGPPRSLGLRVESVRRLAPPCADGVDWMNLPFADVDAALLGLRQDLYGDQLVAEIRCSACGTQGDVPLSITEYLAANRPVRVRGASSQGDGWWTWKDLRFRIPTTGDVLEEVDRAGPGAAAVNGLLRRCVGADSARVLRRLGSILDRMAPPLSGPIHGVCPECGESVPGWIDPGVFVLSELQGKASCLFEQIHLLASCYGWTEELILALPARRRAAYASRIAEERRVS
jgi:hypothetical protein